MEVFRPPFLPGRVAHLTESCNAPPCSAGQRHPPGTELSDQRTITVFATKISIYLHLAHCAVLHKATTSYVYFTSVFDRDSCIFSVFSFGWAQMVENTILQESRKNQIFFSFFFLFLKTCVSFPPPSFLCQTCLPGHSTVVPSRRVSVRTTAAASKRAFWGLSWLCALLCVHVY